VKSWNIILNKVGVTMVKTMQIIAQISYSLFASAKACTFNAKPIEVSSANGTTKEVNSTTKD
jgi:hypothetical protein